MNGLRSAALLVVLMWSGFLSAQPAGLQAGVYWHSGLPGVGFAIDFQAGRAFVVAFSYDDMGDGTWYAGDGEFVDGELTLQLHEFAGGPCLVCGPAPDPARSLGTALPVTIRFVGTAQAVMTILSHDTELTLVRFPLRLVQSEGTIAGVTFTMPDLSGRWLFTDLADGSLHVVTELEVAPSGISDSGIAFFRSTDGSVSMTCGRTIEGAVRCELREGNDASQGEVLFAAEEPDISHDRIVTSEFVGLRLE